MFKPEELKSFVAFDLPFTYKNLTIRLPLVREYYHFYSCEHVFKAEKDNPKNFAKPEDSELIKGMDYLTFMFYLAKNHKNDEATGVPYLFLFDKILKLVCDLPDTKVRLDKDGKEVLGEDKKPVEDNFIDYVADGEGTESSIIIDGTSFTGKEVEEILLIIAVQNDISFIDYSKTKELRDVLDSALTYKLNLARSKMTDLEGQIVALSVYTGWKVEDIFDMSIRRFRKSIALADKLETFRINTLASRSGFTKYPENSKLLDHWLTENEDEDKYGSVLTSFESFTKKITGEDTSGKSSSSGKK